MTTALPVFFLDGFLNAGPAHRLHCRAHVVSYPAPARPPHMAILMDDVLEGYIWIARPRPLGWPRWAGHAVVARLSLGWPTLC